MTEIVQYQPQTALTDQMEYARAVSSASMLPDNYRNRPADIMLAVGLGSSMGLSPAESLYRIAVIKGKPTASAELIAANVRKAGHKLRVRGDESSATASIFRADDPDFEFTVTRDLAWARQMKLDQNDNYKKQPGTMLQWRAITAVARLACPEALYGVAYTSDEIEPDDRPTRTTQGSAGGGLGAALSQQAPTVEQVTDDDPGEAMTPATRGRMFALFNEQGIADRDEQIAGISHIVGRAIDSRGDLTDAEGRQVIAKLEQRAQA